mmetsp:Transcript_30154/g.46067  ORF Transcript_30154/g.46067 Transcript_30154/m.46067 type:complete len:94 (+) Transcript_30154:1225-1506(+)
MNSLDKGRLASKTKSIDLNESFFVYNNMIMESITDVRIPQLNWDDRKIEYFIAQQKFQAKVQKAEDSKPIEYTNYLTFGSGPNGFNPPLACPF